MTDWFTASIKLQKQMLDAQKASLTAGQQVLGAGATMVKMQEAGQKVAKANMDAMSAWAKIWGVGK
ncbi:MULTISPECIES: hypothetical protein [Sphingomonas]|uniref:hypothetical protein n=1 Tax=Sphingomonas TaxID=13687 RepID=UPI00082F7E19|nr:hypothetical protein [Sphingomonas sp. CCH10-B3]